MSIKYDNINNCANHLKDGNLVAFPTETVFGLGANAFNKDAVNKIYAVKERPKTDPLIVHIDKLSRLKEWNLVNLNEEEIILVKKLADKFWPGPLTLILRASSQIPKNITANSEFIGIRIPNNQDALKLIELSNMPIAAPSANKFSHISPTKSLHVENDFVNQNILDSPVYILDSNYQSEIGIESTIIKITDNKIKILRPGYLTIKDLKNVSNIDIDFNMNFKNLNEKVESSGQFIKHYATNCETILVLTNGKIELNNLPVSDNIAVIDIGEKKINESVLYYDNLTEDNNLNDALKNYYIKLREFESFNSENKVKKLYIIVDNFIKNQIYESLIDRIYRTSSGNVINLT